MILQVLGFLVAVGTAAAQTTVLPAPPIAAPQHDIWQLALGSGWVVRLVLLLLVAASVATWGIALAKGREMRRARRQSARFIDVFWEAKNLAAIQAATTEMKESPVAQVFRSGYQELQRLTRLKRGSAENGDESEFGGIETVQRAMQRARTQEVTRLERGLTFLATTASTAPFVGLFGTVWGIKHAFEEIALQQSTNLAVVAPGIAEALLATGLGLLAAIPAVIFYNKLTQDSEALVGGYESFGDEFAMILSRQLDRAA
jgi:biopolymer transport protein TolQ